MKKKNKGKKSKNRKSETKTNTNPWESVDISNISESIENSDRLEQVRISQDETFLLLFTSGSIRLSLHWVNDPEFRGFVHCNGEDCLFCRIGNKNMNKLLLPVYSFDSNAVAVLPISDSMRPHALLPQIANILESGKNLRKRLVLISKDRDHAFTVRTKKLPKDKRDEPIEKIRRFKEGHDAGEIDLTAVFQTMSDYELKQLESVRQKLELLDDE
jgi:hypothetical protein